MPVATTTSRGCARCTRIMRVSSPGTHEPYWSSQIERIARVDRRRCSSGKLPRSHENRRGWLSRCCIGNAMRSTCTRGSMDSSRLWSEDCVMCSKKSGVTVNTVTSKSFSTR
ncbi:hypothetical protein GCM10025883_06960 [Mobilicoccus caccae]|uniref:Uncharacterized protein n=1 Tax=Mobilicoccus caccae TaxID=1859295 RepID=A0ABQ6ILN3_9MICO|nr:hypothetical protein GCM10025883_06960 [Mobilicoccus caccae]